MNKIEIKVENLEKQYLNNKNFSMHNINFSIEQGECVGLIGLNGAGKTTLLKLLAGISKPTKGKIERSGKVSSFIDLMGGFRKELNGKDNIILNCQLYGLRKKEIKKLYRKILKFAEIPVSYIQAPLHIYSSGMLARLGFAIAINMDFDTLLIDESLVVGDEDFQKKCKDKIRALIQTGKTVILASHNLNLIRELCGQVYLMHEGQIIYKDDPGAAVKYYLDNIFSQNKFSVLNKEDLTLIFFQGRLVLYWKDIELTKNNAGATQLIPYLSFFSEGTWKISHKTNTELIVTCKYTLLQLEETWKVTLKENYLYWEIQLSFSEDIENFIFNVDWMFSEEYKKWITDKSQGDFSDNFAKDYWSNIFVGGSETKKIALAAHSTFPEIIFSKEDSPNFKGIILNSNSHFRARVLRYTCKESIKKNQKLEFRGKIELLKK